MSYIKNLNIKDIKLKNNVYLAPMAGVTDIPFRKICRGFGPSLTYTEMASSKAMEFNSTKTEKLLEVDEDERPSVVQIFGSNKDVIANTVYKLNENDNIDIIDINMGCPAPKLVKNGDGAGLLLDLNNVEKIVKEAVKVSLKPITVKTRKGFDENHITAVEVAKICEQNGVAQITIHGRTREEYYSGSADLEIIKKVKESVKIPVIGNGDIVDNKSANKMFEYTKCDGIMVARGAQGNPWIFKSILEGDDYIPTISERFSVIYRHIKYQLDYEDEKVANLKLRKHIAWYIKGLNRASAIKDLINCSKNVKEQLEILKEYEENLIKLNKDVKV
ncbi:tRNA-dihydrouridine synthase [Clostridium sp. CAG:921]|nr:tRNA-dihydrouridine synthase [Clostridium sp. CAG:921]